MENTPSPRAHRSAIRRRSAGILAALVLVAGFAACGDDSDTSTSDGGGSGSDETISIVGFAVPEAANKAIAAAWSKTDAGKGVKFVTSYGASGDQSRAVVDGLEADYVHFSVTSDVTRLVDNDLVADTWDDGSNKGIVSTSIVVFGVPKGNPDNIKDWDDLIEPGVEIVTANPASSGAARWNALAAYGQVIANGGTEAEAQDYLTKFFGNVITLTGSGRDTTTAFLNGTGNVAMLYENEAILARQNGQELDYVVPETTLLIENPGAVLIDATPKANEWLEYVLGPDGQKEFALTGFRPLAGVDVDVDEVKGANDPKNPYPEVKNLLTVQKDFESWSALSKKFFDEQNGIVTKIIAASGKAS